ncbi:MAG: c-type cytochrome [Planctomycetes bacterium]|nr:c-type cytochrome [Planctomycetota bacterium]
MINTHRLSLFAFAALFGFGSAARGQVAPDEELKALRAADGLEISLFASEPMITNPAAIDVDTHGRVWVAEIQWYRRAAKDPPADKIKVLEDTDGDGRADKATVFAEGLFCPMSICVAGSRVYVATSPDLWVYDDQNGDLKADGPPTKLLTGFGGHNHDHGAHSLVLGPDHKWWMSHGDTGFNVAGTDGSKIEYRWGGMLRGELDGSKLETVAVNFRNPYEICVSSFGEAFCSDNDNDGNFSTRICWILEGGNYGWYGAPPFARAELPLKAPPGTPFAEHWHFRGHVPGHVPATLVTGFGSPCGICFYEGDAFGPKYKNAPLHTDAGPREVRIYRHEPAGFGMRATSEVFVHSDGDNYFRPDDICAAPDGSLLIADWYDGGVGGHAYNNPEQGRIFRLRSASGALQRVGKPGPYATVADAIEGLKNPNLATQCLARERLLADGQQSVPALTELLQAGEPNFQARALWLLDRIGGDARHHVVDRLKRDSPAMRALAVRILRRHGAEYADALLPLASDSSAEVQREVLLALRGLPDETAMPVLAKFAAEYDGQDRYLLEAVNIASEGRKPALYAALQRQGQVTADKIQLLQLLEPDTAARFVLATIAKNSLADTDRSRLLQSLATMPAEQGGQSVVALLAQENAARAEREAALKLLAANLPGAWKSLATDELLLTALRRLLKEPGWQQPVLDLVADAGLQSLGGEALALARSSATDAAVRERAIATIAKLRLKQAPAALEKLLGDPTPAVRSAALAALTELQSWPPIRQLFGSNQSPAELRAEAAERLIARTDGALVLLRMIDQKQLPEEIQQQVIARATSHPDVNIRLLYERFIPEDQRPKRLGSEIRPEAILALPGDAGRGAKIFSESSAAQCKSCHRVSNVGGTLGPDLSQIGKKYAREALLETILEPSKAIGPEYIPYLLETTAGQVYAGFLLEKSDEQVTLKDSNSNLVRVAADEMVTLAQQEKSLMPELVLRDMSAQDAADLLAYLSSLTSAVQQMDRFRVAGPFPSPDREELELSDIAESDLTAPDLTAVYRSRRDQVVRWELAACDNRDGNWFFDQAKYDNSRGLRSDKVAHYLLTFADSAADQDVTLLVGSDDSCLVWVNGNEVHRFDGSRKLSPAQDRVPARLHTGRNTIVIKVVNHDGDGGASLSISSPSSVQFRTE